MKIEVWSDFVCPFCYIGKRRLEKALEQFPHKDQVTIAFKSYELDPQAPTDINIGMHEALAQKYNLSIDEARKMTAGVAEQAKTVGLDFHFESMVQTNTFAAHRLTKYAASQGKGAEMSERIFQAYFTESKHIGDQQTLLELASEVGLEQQEVKRVLEETEDYTAEVRADEQLAQQMRVRGVPFFVINQKYAISGAQPTETFLEALHKVWAEESE